MKTLIVFGIRILLLALFTFLFLVLYERGPSGFVKGIPKEFTKLVAETGISLGEKNPFSTPEGPYREPDLPSQEGSSQQEPAPIAPDLSAPEETLPDRSGS